MGLQTAPPSCCSTPPTPKPLPLILLNPLPLTLPLLNCHTPQPLNLCNSQVLNGTLDRAPILLLNTSHPSAPGSPYLYPLFWRAAGESCNLGFGWQYGSAGGTASAWGSTGAAISAWGSTGREVKAWRGWQQWGLKPSGRGRAEGTETVAGAVNKVRTKEAGPTPSPAPPGPAPRPSPPPPSPPPAPPPANPDAWMQQVGTRRLLCLAHWVLRTLH